MKKNECINHRSVLVIGQAPPAVAAEIPFGNTRLYKWLHKIGINQERTTKDFMFAALTDEFPGNNNFGHKVPTRAAIEKYRDKLMAIIRATQPRVIITVGILATKELLQNEDIQLIDVVGKAYIINPYNVLVDPISIIPFPHPSGGSAWIYLPGNNELLERALSLLNGELSSSTVKE